MNDKITEIKEMHEREEEMVRKYKFYTPSKEHMHITYLLQLVETQTKALEKSEKFISSIMNFYGEGLSVHNWHQNGEGEPWDNFFDENMDGDELEKIREALSII